MAAHVCEHYEISNWDLLVILAVPSLQGICRHSHKRLDVSSSREDEATILVRRVQRAADENKEDM